MGLINEFVTATVAVWRQLGLPFGMTCASTARRARGNRRAVLAWAGSQKWLRTGVIIWPCEVIWVFAERSSQAAYTVDRSLPIPSALRPSHAAHQVDPVGVDDSGHSRLAKEHQLADHLPEQPQAYWKTIMLQKAKCVSQTSRLRHF